MSDQDQNASAGGAPVPVPVPVPVPGSTAVAEDLARAASDIERYLARHERKELVRFVAVGSVDDGKSTLIGRLLHDTQGIYEDQLAAVKRATKSKDEEGEIDFSLFTD